MTVTKEYCDIKNHLDHLSLKLWFYSFFHLTTYFIRNHSLHIKIFCIISQNVKHFLPKPSKELNNIYPIYKFTWNRIISLPKGNALISP